MQVDSSESGVTAPASDSVPVVFDSFVFPQPTTAGPDTLSVGGAPAARSLLRTNLPSGIVDSSSVVRAILAIVPSEPVMGASGDSILIVAEGLSADLGAKSPVIGQPGSGAAGGGFAYVTVGQTDTVRIEITELVRARKVDPLLPRTLSLRAFDEGGSAAAIRFHSSRIAIGAPALELTYVPPVVLRPGGG